MTYKTLPVIGLALSVAVCGGAASSANSELKAADAKVIDNQVGGKGAKAAPSDGAYIHVVVMTMKKDTPPEAIEQFINDGYRLLQPRKTVRRYAIGRPANPGAGDMETNYQIAMLVTYDNYQDAEDSMSDPLHTEYDARNLQWVESFKVYDFVDERSKERNNTAPAAPSKGANK